MKIEKIKFSRAQIPKVLQVDLKALDAPKHFIQSDLVINTDTMLFFFLSKYFRLSTQNCNFPIDLQLYHTLQKNFPSNKAKYNPSKEHFSNFDNMAEKLVKFGAYLI